MSETSDTLNNRVKIEIEIQFLLFFHDHNIMSETSNILNNRVKVEIKIQFLLFFHDYNIMNKTSDILNNRVKIEIKIQLEKLNDIAIQQSTRNQVIVFIDCEFDSINIRT